MENSLKVPWYCHGADYFAFQCDMDMEGANFTSDSYFAKSPESPQIMQREEIYVSFASQLENVASFGHTLRYKTYT